MKAHLWTVLASVVLAVAVWRTLGATSPHTPGSLVLKKVTDIELPGGASRFDYQSLDTHSGKLYIAHMGAGELVVFDTKTEQVTNNLTGFPGITGVLAVPELGRVYASVTGKHEVVVLDTQSLKIIARVPGSGFPDGIAYVPQEQKVFVSDESGGGEMVIDARTNQRVSTINIGGEAGNTQFDPVLNLIFVAVQDRNQLVAINPKTNIVTARYDLTGSNHPHGLFIDALHHLAFVACQGNAKLLIVDMRTMKVTGIYPVGDDPDVLSFDPRLHLLYVACESGVVSVFEEKNALLKKKGDLKAPHAHSIAVDPEDHRIYLPLKSVNGRPVLRIMELEVKPS